MAADRVRGVAALRLRRGAASRGRHLPGSSAHQLPSPPAADAALTLRPSAQRTHAWRHEASASRATVTGDAPADGGRAPRRLWWRRPGRPRSGKLAPASQSDAVRAQLEGEWTLVGLETASGARRVNGFLRYDRFANIAVHAELAPDDPGGAAAADGGGRLHRQGVARAGRTRVHRPAERRRPGAADPGRRPDGGMAPLPGVGRHPAIVGAWWRRHARLSAGEIGRAIRAVATP